MVKERPELTQEELLWKVYESSEKVRKHLLWNRIISSVKLIILIIAIVLGVVYLPKFLDPMIDIYKQLLGFSTQAQSMIDQGNQLKAGVDLNSLFEMYGIK